MLASKAQIAALAFHDVCDRGQSSGFQRPGAKAYKLSTRTFEASLDAMQRAGQAPTTVHEVDFDRPVRYLLLTFDDGGKSSVNIGDSLLKRGWRGHFFVTTSLLDTSNFLTSGDVQYMHSCGHVIGSHSHTHPDIFRDLDRERMCWEWKTSVNALEQLIAAPVSVASVPGGDISRLTLEVAGWCGIRFLFTSEPDLTPGNVGNCRVLGRVCPTAASTSRQIAAFAQGCEWERERRVRAAKTTLKRLFAPLYRLYVRKSTET